MTTFRPGARVHLKGHAHTPATTGTVTGTTPEGRTHVMWDDNHTTTPHHPQHLEPAGEPMTDPRIEAAAAVLAEVTGEPRAGRFEYTMARAALAAADNAATITAEDLAHDENFEPVKRFPMGTIVESKDGSVWYWSEDDEWETLNLPGSKSLRGPARVIHWGTE